MRTPSSTNIARIITHSRLQKGRNDINNRSQLHASDHQRTNILILVDRAQTIKNPNHQDHGNAVYT